jgi:hypothetical protein
MINNCKVVNLVKAQNVTTPKWREVNLDEEARFVDFTELDESLDDATFRKRHELHELKERYHTLFKKLEKEKKDKLKLKQQDGAQLNDENNNSTGNKDKNLDDLCLEEFKKLVQKLEAEQNKRSQHHQNGLLSTSLPASLLSAHLDRKYDGLSRQQQQQIESLDRKE